VDGQITGTRGGDLTGSELQHPGPSSRRSGRQGPGGVRETEEFKSQEYVESEESDSDSADSESSNMTLSQKASTPTINSNKPTVLLVMRVGIIRV